MAKKPVDDTDAQILAMIKEVQRQEADIKKAERPNWKTNCSFSFVEGRAVDPISLHVESDIRVLVKIASFIRERAANYAETVSTLNIEGAPKFTWNSYSGEDWVGDILQRIGKLQIEAKRQKLNTLKSRLDAIVSPELRAKLELQAIQAELAS